VETRLARLEDAEAIRQIYNLEVSTSTVTFDLVPRTLHDQITWLQGGELGVGEGERPPVS